TTALVASRPAAVNPCTGSENVTVTVVSANFVSPMPAGASDGNGATLSNVTSCPAGVVAGRLCPPADVTAAPTGRAMPTVPVPFIPVTSTKYEVPPAPLGVTVADSPVPSVPAANRTAEAANPVTGRPNLASKRNGPALATAG